MFPALMKKKPLIIYFSGMILGLGKRYPSVEDEGIISNMIT